MVGAEKKLTRKKLAAMLIAAIIIIAAVVGAYWYLFLQEREHGFRITASPGEVEPGKTVTVSGSGAPADVEVTLTYSEPDSNLTRVLLGLEPIRRTFTRTATSDSDGEFTDTFDSNVTGKWTVTASTEAETSDPVDFYVFVSPPIKIGVIGPMEWIQGMGMREGAVLAADHINEAGGILGRKVVIKTGDEGAVPERGTAETERLCSDEKVHFIYGGFRTEITEVMREVAMNYRIPFTIVGSATPWLIDCATTYEGPHRYPCVERTPGCVRDNYERYKYLFRVMPINTDVLFTGFLVPYLKEHLIPKVLVPKLGLNPPDEKIKIGVIIENLAWTETLRAKLDAVGPLFFGPWYSEIVSKHYILPTATDFSPQLAEMKEKGVHLIFEAFSGEEGLAFIKQWRDLEVPAVPVGINVLSQESEMWDWTGGRCEYEAFLSTMGTKTPVTPMTVPFWDAYVERWGHAPIYTSFGTYDGLMGLAETIEQAALDHPELSDPDTWEAKYNDRTLYDILIPYLENMDRVGILGRAKFTRTHEIYSPGWYAADRGQTDYVKPLVVQWRKTAEGGKMVAVSAGKGSHVYSGKTGWAPYVEEFQLPPWMLE